VDLAAACRAAADFLSALGVASSSSGTARQRIRPRPGAPRWWARRWPTVRRWRVGRSRSEDDVREAGVDRFADRVPSAAGL